MENAELDVALEELENRLERLRALYEQYFMGIERIEPAIPRKDIDRRIYVLRREKIRNTAKRFKLQTIISRYNTFQQYWQRICREIEQGTYKRHVIKAERIAPGKMLTIAARKRLGRAANEAMAEGVQPDSVAPNAEPASLPPAPPFEAPAPIGVVSPAKRSLQNGKSLPLMSSRNTSVVPDSKSRRKAWSSWVQVPPVASQAFSNKLPQLFTRLMRVVLAQLRTASVSVLGTEPPSLPAVCGRPW